VGLLALSGIAVVGAALASAILLVVGIAAIAIYSRHGIILKFAIIPFSFAYMILKALWMRIPEPEGFVVDSKNAPKLMAEIADIRAKLGSLKVHRTLITPEQFNAYVMQIPRLGPLGWSRNYLVIGLPLLEGLSPAEFRSVIGHELGHLSRHQARFRNWIYRSRQMWSHLSEQGGGGLLRPFLSWFGPYFNAYSFVLARANEYDADNAAAAIAGRDVTARTLTSTSIKGNYLGDRYWTDLNKRARAQSEPPTNLFVDYLHHARQLPDDVIDAGLRRALSTGTSLSDTHPCLKDRLLPLGGEPVPPQPVRISAAEEFLGSLRDQLIAETDRKWSENLGERWLATNKEGAEERARIEDFQTRSGSLEIAELLEHAMLVEKHEGAAQASPLLDAAIERQPDYAHALFMRGRLRLSAGDEGGAAEIDEAMRLDADAVEAGSQILYEHFSARRDIESSHKYLQNLTAINEKRAAAWAERSTITTSDQFTRHELTEQGLGAFIETCKGHRHIGRAWLAKKVLKHSPDDALYVLVLDRGPLRKFSQKDLDAVANAVPVDAALVIDRRQNSQIARRIARVAGAPFYTRA
jgi:Zn-dependent protease with chaperone function